MKHIKIKKDSCGFDRDLSDEVEQDSVLEKLCRDCYDYQCGSFLKKKKKH